MKVMILANNDIGLYKFRKELVETLLKNHEVYICLPDGMYVERLVKMGAVYLPCDMLQRRGVNPLKEIELYRYYLKILKEVKPDIVFTYTIKPNVYGGMACCRYGIPYVANVTGLGSAVENSGPLQFITVNLYRIGLKRAKKVFFQNEANERFMLERKVVKDNYDRLPGSGVNLSMYEATKYPEGNEFNFLYIARIMKEKGIDQYLDAAISLRKKYDNVHFHICGFCEEEYEDKLKELNGNGTIVYHGLVDDMASMYKMASCTVHPTYYPEGLSNVLLESCACGRPIITTDRSGCREVIDNGINGFLVKEKDSDDLIDKIERFMKLSYEERSTMGLNARKKVEREFDRQTVIDKYMKELTTIN